MKQHFKYSSPKQLWRILISESDKLILETRDMESKEVFFNCIDLKNVQKIFSDLQHEEKSWIGIEDIYKDIIYFHKYVKPDMPGHKGIIAFDIETQKILWTNKELIYFFADADKVFCFTQGFDERAFYSLNYITGELLEDLGSNYQSINTLKDSSKNPRDWSVYIYPQIFNTAEEKIYKIVKPHIRNMEITGNIEYIVYEDLLLFNYHNRTSENKFDNNFIVININSGKVVWRDVLNAAVSALYTDSFFIYKNFLFLLKGKNEVTIFNLE